MTTKTYQITSITNGVDLGTFEATDEDSAIELCWQAAGYRAPYTDPLCDPADLHVTELRAPRAVIADLLALADVDRVDLDGCSTVREAAREIDWQAKRGNCRPLRDVYVTLPIEVIAYGDLLLE